MSAPGRWIRLQLGWDTHGWVSELESPLARFAWVKLLEHVKATGVAGHGKAMTARAAGRTWEIPVKDVQAMLDAAHKDGALNGDDGEWRVLNWATYQPFDATSAERQAKRRKRLKKAAK